MNDGKRTAFGGALAGLLVAVSLLVGCGGGSKIDCDALSSSDWQSAHLEFNRSGSKESGERALEYAEAIERCAVLEDMTRAEAISWMGKPDSQTGKHTAVWNVSQDQFFDQELIEVNWRNGDVSVTIRR